MDQGTLQGIGTILTFIAFLGVCWWAFSKHKKKDFEEASRLPFADDEAPSGERENGSREQSPEKTVNEAKHQ